MFEQNNVGVQIKSPVAMYVESMLDGHLSEARNDSMASLLLLEATNRIVDSIEGSRRSSFYRDDFHHTLSCYR